MQWSLHYKLSLTRCLLIHRTSATVPSPWILSHWRFPNWTLYQGIPWFFWPWPEISWPLDWRLTWPNTSSCMNKRTTMQLRPMPSSFYSTSEYWKPWSICGRATTSSFSRDQISQLRLLIAETVDSQHSVFGEAPCLSSDVPLLSPTSALNSAVNTASEQNHQQNLLTIIQDGGLSSQR